MDDGRLFPSLYFQLRFIFQVMHDTDTTNLISLKHQNDRRRTIEYIL